MTVVETSWVLTRADKASRAMFVDVLEGLLRSRELVLESPELHHGALAAFRASEADYADCVIALAGRRAGCAATVTFDRMAGASVMQLI